MSTDTCLAADGTVKPLPANHEGIRQAQMRKQPVERNMAFANYTQSTAFSLSLSRRQIYSLHALDIAIKRSYETGRCPIDVGNISQLMRRGLVQALGFDSSGAYVGPKPTDDLFGFYSTHYALTAAGKLLVLLLIEAELIPRDDRPLPPPPPDWVDDRRKISL